MKSITLKTIFAFYFICCIVLHSNVDVYGISEIIDLNSELEIQAAKRNNILQFVSEYVPPTSSKKLNELSLDENIGSENHLYKYIIYILQLEQGFLDNELKGCLHKISRKILPISINRKSDKISIKLVQAALNLNGYICNIDGIWSKSLGNLIANFQKFMKIKQTKIADCETLQALFSSGGNTQKKVLGCDCSQQLSKKQINFLKSCGYKYIGRYLTSKENGRQKHISKEELYNFLDAGFSVILFFQEGMHDLKHCTAEQGIIDAHKAIVAAKNLGIKSGSTIYGVIDDDLDPVDVYMYMKNMSMTLRKYGYKFGIYGSRAICNFAYTHGIASFSYVAGISHNYKGNKGHQMPKNWAFNQEVQVYANNMNYSKNKQNSKFDIDNVVVSGLDQGITKKDVQFNNAIN